jgi:hypothetical protein
MDGHKATTMTKNEWPSPAEFARGLACEEPPAKVLAALEELRPGASQLSLEARQKLAGLVRAEYFRKPGGKARMARMSAEQRSAFARLGGLARRGTGKKK